MLLVTGACRSGKSDWAMEYAGHYGPRRLFLATASPCDTEMEERIKRHQALRDASWTTVEEGHDPAAIIRTHQDRYDVILLDCITLWLTNLLRRNLDDDTIFTRVDDLCTTLQAARIPVIMVTNETGWSIVPENSLARRFRDLSGLVNQRLAQASTRVILTVAGLPVIIKEQHV
ncbi:MAG: bifunctional adenosylcobinamide kinase/adenosylcobinamide-phosphate guanylyltransferase [Deltaproteobacteria bacterium]|nr:MAG: bifunctional adenosylcobinamide kinase/adenosylcobinamide-phosphate guanylyltransferase [Deltaproteobacteria bacterium]